MKACLENAARLEREIAHSKVGSVVVLTQKGQNLSKIASFNIIETTKRS